MFWQSFFTVCVDWIFSSESKSKRVSLKKKYKVIRKVKEHHKKKAKEAKKLGFDKKPKVEKDPGIPNDWPFKEQELKALEVRRQRALQEIEDKKAARKERVLISSTPLFFFTIVLWLWILGFRLGRFCWHLVCCLICLCMYFGFCWLIGSKEKIGPLGWWRNARRCFCWRGNDEW